MEQVHGVVCEGDIVVAIDSIITRASSLEVRHRYCITLKALITCVDIHRSLAFVRVSVRALSQYFSAHPRTCARAIAGALSA